MLSALSKGGPLMVPILLCSVLGVAVIIDRIWFFWRTRNDDTDLIDKLRAPLQNGQNMEAMQLARQHNGSSAAVLAAGAAYADRSPAELSSHLQQAAKNEVYRMEKGLPLLATVITIAPLLGLLGTVTGIIRSFSVLNDLQGIEGPSQLSIGIAEALITTAAGLIVAIPVLAFYEWFNSIINKRVQRMNKEGNQLIDIIADARGEL